jgi:hypothetical protein
MKASSFQPRFIPHFLCGIYARFSRRQKVCSSFWLLPNEETSKRSANDQTSRTRVSSLSPPLSGLVRLGWTDYSRCNVMKDHVMLGQCWWTWSDWQGTKRKQFIETQLIVPIVVSYLATKRRARKRNCLCVFQIDEKVWRMLFKQHRRCNVYQSMEQCNQNAEGPMHRHTIL